MSEQTKGFDLVEYLLEKGRSLNFEFMNYDLIDSTDTEVVEQYKFINDGNHFKTWFDYFVRDPNLSEGQLENFVHSKMCKSSMIRFHSYIKDGFSISATVDCTVSTKDHTSKQCDLTYVTVLVLSLRLKE